MPRYFLSFAIICLLTFCFVLQSNTTFGRAQKTLSGKTLLIKTEPKAIVWLNEIQRGVTDDKGLIEIKGVTSKRNVLRVRAKGFKEKTVTLTPLNRNEITVKLTQTDDEAELLFQQAEEQRDKADSEEDKTAVVELYQRALKLRPTFLAATLGLARALSALGDFEAALDAIDSARKIRPTYWEASVVEGRIYRSVADNANAVKSFQRAIREARGFQPESYTGLALIHEDKEEFEEAIAKLKIALVQLSGSEPLLYLKLAEYYEKLENYKEAIAVYEQFLKVAPDHVQAPAIKSIIYQLQLEGNQ